MANLVRKSFNPTPFLLFIHIQLKSFSPLFKPTLKPYFSIPALAFPFPTYTVFREQKPTVSITDFLALSYFLIKILAPFNCFRKVIKFFTEPHSSFILLKLYLSIRIQNKFSRKNYIFKNVVRQLSPKLNPARPARIISFEFGLYTLE
jgi:hypothetical protein